MPQLEQEASQSAPAKDFLEAMEGLLHHLTANCKAPKLCSLDLLLTDCLLSRKMCRDPPFCVFPLLGRLTQLHSLSLRGWTAQEGDRALMSHLTKLQHLQVFHLMNFRWG